MMEYGIQLIETFINTLLWPITAFINLPNTELSYSTINSEPYFSETLSTFKDERFIFWINPPQLSQIHIQ